LTALDHAMNNTSVILLIQAGDRRLLFCGDAQIENWEYALTVALSSTTDLQLGVTHVELAAPAFGDAPFTVVSTDEGGPRGLHRLVVLVGPVVLGDGEQHEARRPSRSRYSGSPNRQVRGGGDQSRLGSPRPIRPFAGFGVMGRMTVGDAVSARMASGDTADTLEVVDVAQVLARSVLKDKTLDGRAALCGMDAAFLL